MGFLGDFALGAIGGIADGIFGSKSAQRNRNWQERMSNTAHQREVADLRKAGLNPILSASRGASTPSGATAQANLASSAKQMAMVRKELSLMKEQANLTKQKQNTEIATQLKLGQDTNTARAVEQEIQARTPKYQGEIQRIALGNDLLEIDKKIRRNILTGSEVAAEVAKWAQNSMRTLKASGRTPDEAVADVAEMLDRIENIAGNLPYKFLTKEWLSKMARKVFPKGTFGD